MATILQLPSGRWRVQVRRKPSYASETFLRHEDARTWATATGRSLILTRGRACRELKIQNLLSRSPHRATGRLLEAGLRIEQVALVTGHRDWKMLRRYTHLRTEHRCRRLDVASKKSGCGTSQGPSVSSTPHAGLMPSMHSTPSRRRLEPHRNGTSITICCVVACRVLAGCVGEHCSGTRPASARRTRSGITHSPINDACKPT